MSIRVFVYGTLKTGEPNHNVMIKTQGQQRFIAKGVTQQKFPLVIASKYNIPFLLNDPGNGKNIEGEVYEIDDKKLAILDELEAYPRLYDRRIEKVKLADQEEQEAWIYVLKKWRSDIFTISTAPLESYSSEGSHGRAYVNREKRARDILKGETYDLYAEIQGDPSAETIQLSKKKAENDLRTLNN